MLSYFHKGLTKWINAQGTAEKAKVFTSIVTCKSYKKYDHEMSSIRKAQIRIRIYLWFILVSLFSWTCLPVSKKNLRVQ